MSAKLPKRIRSRRGSVDGKVTLIRPKKVSGPRGATFIKAPVRQKTKRTANFNELMDKWASSPSIPAFGKKGAPVPKFKLTPETIDYIEMVTNPFGETRPGRSRDVACGIPDVDGVPSYVAFECGRYLFTPTEATSSGLITLAPYCYTASEPSMTILVNSAAPAYDFLTASTTCATSIQTVGVTPQRTMLNSLITSADSLRVTAAGIRVNSVSSPQNTSGALYGYNTDYQGSYGGTPGNNIQTAILTKYPAGPSYSVADGICVRRRLDTRGLTYVTPPQHYYVANSRSPYGFLPQVGFTGLQYTAGAETKLEIEWVIFYEVQTSTAAPFGLNLSEGDPEFDSAMKYINELELTAKGRSFKSFLQTAWKNLKERAIETVKDPVKLAAMITRVGRFGGIM